MNAANREPHALGGHGAQMNKNKNGDRGYCTTPGQISPLVQAKERISIAEAWVRLGLPGKPCQPGKSCCTPWREDKSPSFSITPDGKHWKDFATGEHGSVVDFIAKALGCSISEAAKKLIEMAGSTPPKAYSIGVRAVTSKPVEARKPRPIPLEKPTYRDLLDIQDRRQLPSTGGLHVAVERGLLWVANVWDNGEYARCWVVTDNARIGAQARRMDGRLFTKDGNTFKPKTLSGYKAGWPIGVANFGEPRDVILTEGPPDMLAAMTIAAITPGVDMDALGFACICGAGNKQLMPESLTYFQGKNVRLVYDQDAAGKGACEDWCKLLSNAGASVLTFDLAGMTKKDGTPAKDLNDVTYFVRDDGETAGPDFQDGLEELVCTSGEEVTS
jgi:hypothetical protein